MKCPELTGKDEFGRPLHDHHAHAHIIPLDLDGDGRFDHILIYAKMGLGEEAQRAIRSLRRTSPKGGVGDLQLAIVGSGDLEILRKPRLKTKVCELRGLEGGSCTWENVTPFVLPRFPKEKGKNTT